MLLSTSDRLSGCAVLVVDDEESIRELVRDGLAVRGVRVDVAASAEEALSLIKRHTYDAVLCDLNLRNSLGSDLSLSGREFHARLGEGQSAHRPFFLFMTGELVVGPASDDLAASGVPTLQKPFRISELIAILTDAMFGTPVTRSPNGSASRTEITPARGITVAPFSRALAPLQTSLPSAHRPPFSSPLITRNSDL